VGTGHHQEVKYSFAAAEEKRVTLAKKERRKGSAFGRQVMPSVGRPACRKKIY
jgi:hypothetical protein